MSIAPNSGKPIFPSWEQTQQTAQPAFGSSMGKLLTAFRDFGQKAGLTALSPANSINISSLGPLKGKPPSILGKKGQSM
jgi:hypothetical protein